MRKMKKIAALSMSLLLAFSSAAGCTKKSSKDMTQEENVTIGSTQQTTEDMPSSFPAFEETKPRTDMDATQGQASGSETKNAEQTSDEFATSKDIKFDEIETSDSLTKVLNMMDGVTSMLMKFQVIANIDNTYPGEWSLGGTSGYVRLRMESQWDMDRLIGDGYANLDINTNSIRFSDELLHYVLDKNEMQVATTLPVLLSNLLGGQEQIDMMLKQFGLQITFDDIQRISRFTIPVGSGIMNPSKLDESARSFFMDYLSRILREVDASCITVGEDEINLELNGALVASLMRSMAKNTNESDYRFFYKYLQESGTPSYNETELKAAAGRLADQINIGFKNVGAPVSVTEEDLLSMFGRLYSEVSDGVGAQLFMSEEEMRSQLESFLSEARAHTASKESYEAFKKELDQELQHNFKDGFPTLTIHYDDANKILALSASFVVTDEATGEKINMVAKANVQEYEVEIHKIDNTVPFSDVVSVGYKVFQSMGPLLGAVLGIQMNPDLSGYMVTQ